MQQGCHRAVSSTRATLPSMPTEYVTVYQVARDSHYASFAHLVVIFSIVSVAAPIGLGLVFLVGKMRFHWRQPHWLVSVCLFALGFLALLIARPGNQHQDSDALLAYQKGDYQVVEGIVTNFDPMPYEGHKSECFSVLDKRFCYSDYAIDPGFRNTASHGGPIRSGLKVRIAYKPTTRRNMILRIDVGRDQTASSN
jgi:hypothetical protein